MNRHANFDIADALIALPDGSFSSWELERQPKIGWIPMPGSNARPSRIKWCPWCSRRLPIKEFLVESATLRTVVVTIMNERYAVVCSDVREWCAECDARVIYE